MGTAVQQAKPSSSYGAILPGNKIEEEKLSDTAQQTNPQTNKDRIKK